MQLDALKVFCDLVETNSFSKAAVLNGVSQSAVSQQVRAIEVRLGCTLLERRRKQLALTAEGQAFHHACKEIMSTWQEMEAQIGALKNEVAGELRIASIYSIGLHELPPRLKLFRSRFPTVEVKVDYRRASQVYEMVEAGQADIGLVAYPARRPNVIHEVFDEDRLVLICHPSHPLAQKQHVSLKVLDSERFIAFEPDAPTRKMIDRNLRSAGVRVSPCAEFDNIETVKRAVEIESGVSIVPANTVHEEVAAGVLVAVEIDAPKMSRPLGYILNKRRTRPPGLKQLIEVLKESPMNFVAAANSSARNGRK
jgi:LysR family transcriptional regulator, transcriptional activator of the cysJI operon